MAEPAAVSVAPGSSAARVAGLLLTQGPRTAAQLALDLDITVQAVRRQVDHLCELGLVVGSPEPPYGPRIVRGRGRPAKVYSLTQAGRESFGQGYGDLAAAALAFMARSGGAQLVASFAQERAAELVGQHAGRVADAEDPAAELARALTEQGYAATVVDDGGPGVQLCQLNCPVVHVAEQFPQLCEAEAQAVSAVLGRHVVRLATIAHGDGVCTLHMPGGAQTPPDPQTPSDPAARRKALA